MKKVIVVAVLILTSLGGICLFIGYLDNHRYSKEIIAAISKNDDELFEKLIEDKRDLDSTPYLFDMDRVNMPPLHYACKEGKYEYVVKLVEAGADVNNVSHSNKTTPLIESLMSLNKNRIEIAEFLIESGANINIEVNNYTALDYVFTHNVVNYNTEVEKEEFEFAVFLIESGADYTNVRLGNLIFNASKHNNLLMVDYLLTEKEVYINLADNSYGNTALIWATMFDCYNIVEYLINHGADIYIVNSDGKTVFDIVHEQESLEGAELDKNIRIKELLNEKLNSQ